MPEKIEKIGVNRDPLRMYYIKDGAVWSVRRKGRGILEGRPRKVVDGSFQMDADFIYYLDPDGDVSRVERESSPDGRRIAKRRTRPLPRTRPTPFEAESRQFALSSFERSADPEQTAILLERALAGHQKILSILSNRLKTLSWTKVEQIWGAVDLWGTAPDGKRVIFEAKTTRPESEGIQVRSAIGQLLWYRHIHGKRGDLLALVTDRRLAKDRVAFLRSLNICPLYVTGSSVRSYDSVPSTLREIGLPMRRTP